MNDETELQLAGYQKVYDYTQYSHENHVNIIPEDDFKRLVKDTFKTIADNLRRTYGPYGSQLIISDQSQTMTTKDGFNAYEAIGFSHTYKRIVYLAIQEIIKRVNRNVGDGTTTCILLAEKIFNNIADIIKTPDDKRLLLETLTKIEKNLQDVDIVKDDIKNGYIKKLDRNSIKKLISMAANYDEELTEVIYRALDPEFDEIDDSVMSVRHVVPTDEVSLSVDSNATYDIYHLPGDYRVPIHMIDVNDEMELSKNQDIRIVIYDHAFSSADWAKFRKNWDYTDTLIIARTYATTFLKEDLIAYARERKMMCNLGKAEDDKTHLYLAQIKGDSIQEELRDLAEIIGGKVHGMYDDEIDFENESTVNVQLYNRDCLCIYNVADTNHLIYIKRLEYEFESDKSKSQVKQSNLNRRIKSLSFGKEALLNVKCGTQLEGKLITDKITDCISIVDSAINTGIVPNLLNYAFYRMYKFNESDFEKKVSVAIRDSITELFEDIYISKYGKDCDEYVMRDRQAEFYSQRTESYDIIYDDMVPMFMRPTSSQYDTEVIVAALSIVKYLLSGGALIFDAHYQTNVNDEGRYIR